MSELVTTQTVDLRCDREGCNCRERRARIDFFAFRVFREETGKSLMRGASLEEMDDHDMVALVYAALKDDDPELTIEHVERHLTPLNAQRVLITILSLVALAFPEQPAAEGGRDPLTRRRPAKARRRKS
jgi:hypothetical protein